MPPVLAAIRFEKDGDIDALLQAVASVARLHGLRLSGVLQTRGDTAGDCHCADMDLVSLNGREVFRISQPLGNGARGCRLNPEGLALCAAALERDLGAAPDLLILNRFGKGESEGRGFRDLIGRALEAGVPVLTAVRATYAADWREFGGDLACDLPPRLSAVLDWVELVVDHRAAA